jgi:hypothetical protein
MIFDGQIEVDSLLLDVILSHQQFQVHEVSCCSQGRIWIELKRTRPFFFPLLVNFFDPTLERQAKRNKCRSIEVLL